MRFSNPARINWSSLGVALFIVAIFFFGYYANDYDPISQLGIFMGLSSIAAILMMAWSNIDEGVDRSIMVNVLLIINIIYRLLLLGVLMYDLFQPVSVPHLAQIAALILAIVYGFASVRACAALISFSHQKRHQQTNVEGILPFISD